MEIKDRENLLDYELLREGTHSNPHRFLGLHEKEIRLWRPGAKEVVLEVLGERVSALLVRDGLFVVSLWREIAVSDYRIYSLDGKLRCDPYSFPPTVGAVDQSLFSKGCHYELYRVLGANEKTILGVQGISFAVWAPNAKRVSLVADFNHFDGRSFPMRSMGASGIWEIFIPGVEAGEKYKFEILTKQNEVLLKSDPFAFASELRPNTASIVTFLNRFAWKDSEWMALRKDLSLKRPILIYELHLGSWKKKGDRFPCYREIAHELSVYCVDMGFTHVELLPVMEHPLDESWGYQVSGFFAPTSRYGSFSDFQYFVDHLHLNGIGVILDWVPAHFPMDGFGLIRFDGTALYEHEDPRLGIHPHWHTAIFNYGRKEVANFLIASALFWISEMHIDGIRVDAVASMLYLDYGRKEGEWIPNREGTHFNFEAIEFLKHLNAVIHQKWAGVLMMAEESSAFQGVTHDQGLGFDLKWNMGWMNDTLNYMRKDPLFRKHHQNDLSFSLLYAFSERFLLPLSHDEVVHGKGSLLSKMPGNDAQKFANLRLLYSYMMGHPGKKLLFMGGEIGEWAEWNESRSLHWDLLQYPLHAGLQKMVRDQNKLYREKKQYWAYDFSWEGYEWVDFHDANQSVIAYLRKSSSAEVLLFVHHFTPNRVSHYPIALKKVFSIVEIFNTDSAQYGGENHLNQEIGVTDTHITISLAPLATMVFLLRLE